MTAELNETLRAEILKKIPLGSLGQAEDIAAAALYLAGASGALRDRSGADGGRRHGHVNFV